MHVDFWVTPKGSTPVKSTLGDTSSTAMFIHLSQPYAPAGPVTFIITNTSTTMKHELVGFGTKTLAADYPDHQLRGRREQDRREQGRHPVIDTGAALAPGAIQMLTVD